MTRYIGSNEPNPRRPRFDLLAYDAPSGLAVTGFDLQGASNRLPHIRQTLPDVEHRNVHKRHLDGSVGPQLDVVHSSLVRLHVTAAKQLRRPADGDNRRASVGLHTVG